LKVVVSASQGDSLFGRLAKAVLIRIDNTVDTTDRFKI